MNIDEPWSAWSAAIFPAAGALVLYDTGGTIEAGVLAFFLAILGVATFGFHAGYNRITSDFDHAAMTAALAVMALLSVGAPVWFAAVGAAGAGAAEVVLDLEYRPILGAFGLVVLGALGPAGAWDAVGASLFTFAAAAWMRSLEGDIAHAAWHVGAAFALAIPMVELL